MRIALGAIVADIVGLNGDDPYFETLARFDTRKSADVVVDIVVDPAVRRAFDLRNPLGVTRDAAAGSVTLRAPRWCAHLDLAGRHIDVAIADLWPPAIDQVLKTVAQVYAPTLGKGLILHASALGVDGRAVVFAARSETGKTTVARFGLARGHTVLTEEMACVTGLGEGETPRVVVMPVREKEDLLVKRPLSVPLSRVYWLRQADEDRIEALTPARQIAHAAMSAAIGVRDAVVMQPALDMARALVGRVPFELLHFRRSPCFWKLVEDEVSGVKAGGCAAPTEGVASGDRRNDTMEEAWT